MSAYGLSKIRDDEIHCGNSLYYCVVPLYNYWSSTLMIMHDTLQAEEISFYHIFGIYATIKLRQCSGNGYDQKYLI